MRQELGLQEVGSELDRATLSKLKIGETVTSNSGAKIATYSYNDQNRLAGTVISENGTLAENDTFTYDINWNQLTELKIAPVNGVPVTDEERRYGKKTYYSNISRKISSSSLWHKMKQHSFDCYQWSSISAYYNPKIKRFMNADVLIGNLVTQEA